MAKLKSLYLSLAHTSSGKTEIALGIATMLEERGYSIGYFKPFGRAKGKSSMDTEAQVMAKIFGLDEALISPTFLDPVYFETMKKNQDSLRDRIHAGYNVMKDAYDFVIIVSAKKNNNYMSFQLDDASLSVQFESPVISINMFERDEDICDLLTQKEIMQARNANYAGSLFTRVPKIMVDRLQQEFIPYIETLGIKTFGVLPFDARIAAPTFREIMEEIGGQLLDEDESIYNLDVLVFTIMIGAMSSHSALSYLRSGKKGVIITGGDRSDIVLTALETDIVGVILTGNLYPDQHVISAAREKGVPILLVPYDTFTTTTKVEQTSAGLQIEEKQVCKEMVERAINIDEIIELLTP